MAWCIKTSVQGPKKLARSNQSKTSRKQLTVAIFQKWQDSSVALWIEIAVIHNWRQRLEIWFGLVQFGMLHHLLILSLTSSLLILLLFPTSFHLFLIPLGMVWQVFHIGSSYFLWVWFGRVWFGMRGGLISWTVMDDFHG